MSLHVAEVFYSAFQARNHETMAACYAPGALFTDPVFDLAGEEIGHMWRMLCQGSDDLQIEYDVVDMSDTAALIDWVATYTFTPTGRPVRNSVQARLGIEEGRIGHHVDLFSFYGWAAQAFGATGAALGWSPLFRRRVRSQARRSLQRSVSPPDLDGDGR